MSSSIPSKRAATPPGSLNARKTKAPCFGLSLPGSTTQSEVTNSVLPTDPYPDDTITLLVGEYQFRLTSSERLLTKDSQFFTAAIRDAWLDEDTRTIELPEGNPYVMTHYLSYIDDGVLYTEDTEEVSKGEAEFCYKLLSDLYVAGERFMHRRLQNHVMAEILRISRLRDETLTLWYPASDHVNTIYRGTPPGSPGRRLLVDMQVVMGTKDWMDHDFEIEFVNDVAKAFHDKVHNMSFRQVDLQDDDYML